MPITLLCAGSVPSFGVLNPKYVLEGRTSRACFYPLFGRYLTIYVLTRTTTVSNNVSKRRAKLSQQEKLDAIMLYYKGCSMHDEFTAEFAANKGAISRF